MGRRGFPERGWSDWSRRMRFEHSLIDFDHHETGSRSRFPTRDVGAGNSSRCFLGAKPLPLYFLAAPYIPN